MLWPGYAAPENCATPWWAVPLMVVNSPPNATRELVMAAPKAPKTPLASGAQDSRPPEEVRAAGPRVS